jgi:uncharacterized membrane protein
MSEHHRHTEFLKHCLRYDDSPEHQAMMEKLTRIQRELRIVQRASWLMGLLAALVVVSLTYPVILVHNFPYNMQRFIMNIFLALFMGLLISLVAFVGLGIILRKKMHRQREECRQLLMRLLAARFDLTS